MNEWGRHAVRGMTLAEVQGFIDELCNPAADGRTFYDLGGDVSMNDVLGLLEDRSIVMKEGPVIAYSGRQVVRSNEPVVLVFLGVGRYIVGAHGTAPFSLAVAAYPHTWKRLAAGRGGRYEAIEVRVTVKERAVVEVTASATGAVDWAVWRDESTPAASLWRRAWAHVIGREQ